MMKKLLQKLVFINLLLFALFFKSQKEKDTVYDNIQSYLYEDPAEAIKIAQKLIKAETNIDKKIKYTLYLSKAYTATRNTDESYKTLLKAQELLKNSTDVVSKIDVMLIIAIQYQQMELYNKSFETLDKADEMCNQLDPKYEKQKNAWLGKSFAVKGIIYKSQGNMDIALQKFLTSLKYLEKAEQSTPNVNNTSIVYYNIGYCHLNSRKFSESERSFKKSIEFAEKSKAESLTAYAMKGLAENYAMQRENQKSLELLSLANEKSESIGDLLLNEGIAKSMAYNYLSLGNFDQYLANYDRYKKIQFNREQSDLKSINSLLNNLDVNLNAEVKKQSKKALITNFLLILVSILISSFLAWKIFQKNRKNKLSQKKLENLFSGKLT